MAAIFVDAYQGPNQPAQDVYCSAGVRPRYEEPHAKRGELCVIDQILGREGPVRRLAIVFAVAGLCLRRLRGQPCRSRRGRCCQRLFPPPTVFGRWQGDVAAGGAKVDSGAGYLYLVLVLAAPRIKNEVTAARGGNRDRSLDCIVGDTFFFGEITQPVLAVFFVEISDNEVLGERPSRLRRRAI